MKFTLATVALEIQALSFNLSLVKFRLQHNPHDLLLTGQCLWTGICVEITDGDQIVFKFLHYLTTLKCMKVARLRRKQSVPKKGEGGLAHCAWLAQLSGIPTR